MLKSLPSKKRGLIFILPLHLILYYLILLNIFVSFASFLDTDSI